MNNKNLQPLSLPDFRGVEAEHIMSVLRMCEDGKGEEVLQNFEEDFKALLKIKHCIPVSSATSGLHLALMALGVGEGDEVICPTFTFAASAFPIMYQRAIPVFVDSELTTWNMSPIHLETAINARMKLGKKPKAIIIVHGYGTPADIKSILKISGTYSIPVIEDSANALGSTYLNQQAGTFGKIGVFSFNRNKIISGGAGGAVVTNDKAIAEQVRYLAHQAKSPASYYLHENVGYNYGMSPILAEIIRQQLPTLSERIIARRMAFFDYAKGIKSDNYQNELKDSFSNRWLTTLKLSKSDFDKFEPVSPRHVWKPMHTQPVFQQYPYHGNNESLELFNTCYCLPYAFQEVLVRKF